MADNTQPQGSLGEVHLGEEPTFPGVDWDELDDVSQLNRVLAELGSSEQDGAFVSVYRMSKIGRDGEFLDRYPVEMFADGSLLDTVRNEWGAGKYQFSVYAGTGGLKARKVITIAPRKNESGISTGGGKSDEVTRVLEMIAQQNAQTQKMFETLAAAIVNNKQSAPSESDMLDKMVKYKELFGGEKSDTTKALLEGIALARELEKPGETDSSWVDKVMTKLAVPAMEMIAANNKRQMASQQKQVGSEVAALPQTREVQEENQQGDSDEMLFKMGVKMLLSAAKKKENVSEVADRVLMMLSIDDARTLVELDNWFEVLCHHEPECASHKEWFAELHKALKEVIAIEDGGVSQ